ncbi:hypothetical protein [Natrialba aegyptia]|uniref:Uncharacterized protein n=1 Tax=Natrialba aegyptia DSM 13077 TaxID=1227491 RepID=M0AYD6_9EURY|nr:hypothetical protein [Natrialba aegyptia]ELZ03337.1 hypothetical protein C480_16430 [Natrialba aegyptia DSM 13077]
MKRTLAITLTVALIGGLMFMGFAGTAAAQNDVDQETGDATVDIDVDQENNNAQVGVAESSSSPFSVGYHSSTFSYSDAEVNQVQLVEQTNENEIEDVSAESGDNINVDVGDIAVDGLDGL